MRVGVVGLGAIGQQHVAIYESMHGVDVIAVADFDLKVARASAERHGALAFESASALLQSAEVDAISLCTPDQLHFDDAKRIIEAGKHLLIEKPLATTVVEADELAVLGTRAAVVVLAGHTPRYDPRYNAAKAALDGGNIGEVVHGYIRRNNKLSVARRVGGRTSVTFFLGVHDLFVLLWLTERKIVEVQAMGTKQRTPEGRQAIAVVANLRLDNGAVVQLEAGWGLPDAFPTEIDARLRLVGDHGELAVDIFDQGIRVFAESYLLPAPAGTPLMGVPQGTLREELNHFVAAIQDGRSLPVSLVDAANAVRVAEAIDNAVASGTSVAIHYPDGF